jgi:hypothetical protein
VKARRGMKRKRPTAQKRRKKRQDIAKTTTNEKNKYEIEKMPKR